MSADTPWPHEDIADTPLARLAWDLQGEYRFDLPPHLAIEELAQHLADHFGLEVPVGYSQTHALLRGLGIQIDPPFLPSLSKGCPGNSAAIWEQGLLCIQVNHRDAETRQTLTLWHEFYELLRGYLHQFDCAPFPAGMKKNDYVPEKMSHRFSAAITLPQRFIRDFLDEYGLDVPLLIATSGRSQDCVVRRIRELLAEGFPYREPIPFLALRLALKPTLLQSDVPRVRCTISVRAPALSIKRGRRGVRAYEFPRVKEEWRLGTLLETVLRERRPVFVWRALFDLLDIRTLSALAVPEWENQDDEDEDPVMVGIAIYATPSIHWSLWERAGRRLACLELHETHGLLGLPVSIFRMKGPFGAVIRSEVVTINGEEKYVNFHGREKPRKLFGWTQGFFSMPPFTPQYIRRDDPEDPPHWEYPPPGSGHGLGGDDEQDDDGPEQKAA